MTGQATSTFLVKVMENDSDPDGDVLTLQSCSVSAQGAVVEVTGDKCTYRHPDAANWTAPDTFTYVVSDGHGGSATGTVTVTGTSR